MDAVFARTFNVAVMSAMTLVAIGMLLGTLRPGWAQGKALRAAYRAGLPLDGVAPSVSRHLAVLYRTRMWVLLAIMLAGIVLAATIPAGSTPGFSWLIVIAILAAASITSVIVQVRERLFRPTPEAVRIARPRSMRAADYLGGVTRRLPYVLLAMTFLAAAGMTVVQMLRSASIGPLVAVIAYGGLALAVVVAVLARGAERTVLGRPQPASNTLELAWDDLFRADALLDLRQIVAVAAWIPLGASLSALVMSYMPSPQDQLALFPWWGLPCIMCAYSFAAGRLRPGIHPVIVPKEAIA